MRRGSIGIRAGLECGRSLHVILGIAGSAAMALSAGILAGGLFRTQEAAFVIRCMAPSVLIASLAGALRGYFQGMGSMVPTAFSRFAEELAGFLLMFSLVSGLGGYGKKVGALLFQPDYEQAFGAGGAALAFGAGSLISLLLLPFCISSFREASADGSGRMRKGGGGLREHRPPDRSRSPARILTGFAMQGSFILDQVLFMRLMPAGADSAVQWGIYTGKYRILSSIPAMLTAAVCTGLIPSLSVSHTGMNPGRTREKAFLMLKLSLALSLPFAVWSAVTADSLIPALFTAGDMETAARLLRLGCVSMVLQALAVGIACILQGLGGKGSCLSERQSP